MFLNSLAIEGVDGNSINFGQGAIIAIVSVLLVFIILALIIGITYLCSMAINSANGKTAEKENVASLSKSTSLTDEDPDALVATIVASIDYRNQTKKNIKVLNVKEIK